MLTPAIRAGSSQEAYGLSIGEREVARENGGATAGSRGHERCTDGMVGGCHQQTDTSAPLSAGEFRVQALTLPCCEGTIDLESDGQTSGPATVSGY